MSLEGQKREESGVHFDVSETLESVEAAEKQLSLVKDYLVIYDEYRKLMKEWRVLNDERLRFNNENVGQPGWDESMKDYRDRLAGIAQTSDTRRMKLVSIFDELTDETKDTYLADEKARDF